MRWIKRILVLLVLLPMPIYAYSNKLIVMGDPIGIELYSSGVYITDFYKVNNKWLAKNNGFLKGDRILEVNHQKITSIQDFNDIVSKSGDYVVLVERKGIEKELSLAAVLENDSVRTGMYLKDQIQGIGTLSYIDPDTGIYASLGHEISEKSSSAPFQMNHGFIFPAQVYSVEKNTSDRVGEIHANYSNEILGSVLKNTFNGIYGHYLGNLKSFNTIEIMKKDGIRKGMASIRLNIDNDVKDYSIRIISIDEGDPLKNIYFEIVDEELLSISGGIVQGMSGAPILQNGKIIGVVNYAIINDNHTGYGVFIETMLEEGDKLLQE